jgi:hypothetical protein
MMLRHSTALPVPLIRAPVGDIIDCHASEGSGGGATPMICDENQTESVRFRLLNACLLIYHCHLHLIKNFML